MFNFIRSFPLLIIAAVVLIVFLFLTTLLLLPRPETQNPDDLPAPTPVEVDVSVNDRPLTAEERNFPQPTPQPYRNEDLPGRGTLVLTSDIEGVVVLLEAIGIHPEEDDPIARDEKWPENPLPLTVYDIPEGRHFLTALAPGKPYDMTEYEFEIKDGEITRINIELKPLNISN